MKKNKQYPHYSKSLKKKWNGINFTKAAIKQIEYLLTKKPINTKVTLYLKKSGCAGFKYVLELTNKIEINKYELVFNISKNIKLIVSTKSMHFLDNTEIDFVKEGLNSSFKFKNSKIKNSCGCGESFEIMTV